MIWSLILDKNKSRISVIFYSHHHVNNTFHEHLPNICLYWSKIQYLEQWWCCPLPTRPTLAARGRWSAPRPTWWCTSSSPSWRASPSPSAAGWCSACRWCCSTSCWPGSGSSSSSSPGTSGGPGAAAPIRYRNRREGIRMSSLVESTFAGNRNLNDTRAPGVSIENYCGCGCGCLQHANTVHLVHQSAGRAVILAVGHDSRVPPLQKWSSLLGLLF